MGSRRVDLSRGVTARPGGNRVAEIAFAEYGAAVGEVLLDTHVWVGLLAPDVFALPPTTLDRLLAVQQAGGLRVPDVAIWEIALKAGKGSLLRSGSARSWLDRARTAPGTRAVPFSAEMMIRTAELGSGAPSDPFDRAIIATALVEGIPLVTADRGIIAWARGTQGLQVVEAR